MKYTGFILVRTKNKATQQYVITNNTFDEIRSILDRIHTEEEVILSCSFTIDFMVK